MAEFVWRARRRDGQVLEGRSDADNNLVVLKQLRDRGLTPIRIEGTAQAGAWRRRRGPARRAVGDHGSPYQDQRPRGARAGRSQADVLALTTELAIMLRAGLALDNALRVLIEMAAKPAVQQLLQQVLDDVKGGVPFSRALGRHRDLFGDFYINMVRSGEASGQLSEVLTRLVEHHGAAARTARERDLGHHLPGDPAGCGGALGDRDARLRGAAVRKTVHRHGRRIAAAHPHRDDRRTWRSRTTACSSVSASCWWSGC